MANLRFVFPPQIQQLTDEFTENVDILLEEKTKDLFRS